MAVFEERYQIVNPSRFPVDRGFIVTDLDQTGMFVGKPTGRVWLQEIGSKGWETFDFDGNRDIAEFVVNYFTADGTFGPTADHARAAIARALKAHSKHVNA